MGFLVSCDRDLREALCCLREVKYLSSCEGEPGIALYSLQENRASFHFEGGIYWCFLSCGGKRWFPLNLRLGPQGTSGVASGKSSLLSSCEGERGIGLESLQGNWASS